MLPHALLCSRLGVDEWPVINHSDKGHPLLYSTTLQSFPGGKENRIDLPASPSATPSNTATHSYTSANSDWSLCADFCHSSARKSVKRKVLRRSVERDVDCSAGQGVILSLPGSVVEGHK